MEISAWTVITVTIVGILGLAFCVLCLFVVALFVRSRDERPPSKQTLSKKRVPTNFHDHHKALDQARSQGAPLLSPTDLHARLPQSFRKGLAMILGPEFQRASTQATADALEAMRVANVNDYHYQIEIARVQKQLDSIIPLTQARLAMVLALLQERHLAEQRVRGQPEGLAIIDMACALDIAQVVSGYDQNAAYQEILGILCEGRREQFKRIGDVQTFEPVSQENALLPVYERMLVRHSTAHRYEEASFTESAAFLDRRNG